MKQEMLDAIHEGHLEVLKLFGQRPAVTATTTSQVPAAAGVVVPAPAPAAPVLSADDYYRIGVAKIATWLAPVVDWTKVTVDELAAIYRHAKLATGVSTLHYDTGLVTWQGGDAPAPNFEIQSRVLRGLPTSETERAYVGYNNADGIGMHFVVAADGSVTPR